VKTQKTEHLHFFNNCRWASVLSWPCYLSRAKFCALNEPLEDQGGMPGDRNELLSSDRLKTVYKIRAKSNEDKSVFLTTPL